ncbi:MAG: hypothetical protein M1361_01670 [Patescibacteria group bacterium]|nr:hypothetical protein [Patescibacteria group bacterium]
MSQVLGRCCPSKLETFSLILPGIDGRNQVLRLGKFKNRFKCNLNFILAESFYPFKDIVENGITEPFDPLIEPYRDSFSRLIELAKAKSINIMFNGVGGDELLSLRGGVNLDIELDSEVSDRREKDIPNYFPADLKNALLDEEHIMNNLLVSSYTGVASSIYRANLATNSLFINKGIWCVAPLANPAIVDFCYNLPSRLRRNYKKLLYLYQYKYSFPRSFYPGKHKDTFTPLLLSALRGKASNLLTELFSESLLAKYGFLNRSKLIRAYLDFINRKIFPEHSDSFYEIAVLEIFLRSMIS